MSLTSILILSLIALQILHLIEEIKTGFRHKLLIGTMPLPVFIGINIALYLFCFFTLFLSISGNSLAIPFSWIFALGTCLNGLGHIGIMAVKRSYFPGGLTAYLLASLSIFLLVHLMVLYF